MHYLDLSFTVKPQDLRHFQTAFFAALHAEHGLYGVAITFPYWKNNEPNATDTFDSFTRYAIPGNLIRLFAPNEQVLARLGKHLEFEKLQAQGLVSFSPVRAAPAGCRGVAYVRARGNERAIKLSRIKDPENPRRLRDSLELRQAREAKARSALHEQAYFMVSSKSSGQGFSLFVERLQSDVASECIAVNSYGLSNKIQPCYLPDF